MRRRCARRRWFLWTLATVVLACAAATAASGDARARDQARAGAVVEPDTDGDGLSDSAEQRRYHTNPRKRDTDGDALDDREEVRRYHSDPRKRDTDGDGLGDSAEVHRYHTNPRKQDTDGDGLSDREEVRRYDTDPRKRDSDGDGLRDSDEVRRHHTDPHKRDTDDDAYSDRAELAKDTDPRDPRSRPGFPREDTTGVPPGTVLSQYLGPPTISTPNTVIDGKMIGCIRVTAPGVVIRNSKISCGEISPVASYDVDYTGTPLLIEDSEIDCQLRQGTTGITDSNVIARRVNIHGCENGLSINQNVLLEDSYIHDLYNSDAAHTDGIQFTLGHWDGTAYVCCSLNITIRHNTIYGMGADGLFGTSAIISNRGGDTNILIENNLLAGGAFTLYCEQGAKGNNYRVVNNRFSRKFGARVGFYGPSADCADETQSGNVFHETGRPLRLP